MNNMKIKGLVCGALALLATGATFGFSLSMYPYELPEKAQGAGMGCTLAEPGMELELGKWYTNFDVVKAYCEEKGIPMVSIWSNHTCIHCWYTDLVFVQDTFKTWAETHDAGQVIYCFCAGSYKYYDQDGKVLDQKGTNAYNWMWNGKKLKAFPFTAFYWKKDGVVKVEKHLTGDDLCKGSAKSALNFGDSTIPKRVENVIAYMENVFKDWHPVPAFTAGEFVAGDTEGNRLEAEAGTTNVIVELVRSEEAAGYATNGVMSVLGPDGTELATFPLEWKDGDVRQTVAVEIPADTFTKPGEQISLILTDEDGLVGGTNHITYVETETSAANPLWLGERTVETLGFGEWTMDLDTAKAKVFAASGNAYTLVSVQGSMWCPDCANTERNFLSLEDGEGNNRFEAWAASKQIALVTVDIPNFTGTNVTDCATPCLLSSAAYATTLARAKEFPASGASESETNAVSRSGAGYLSRKGVSPEAAAAQLEKVHDLVLKNTDEDGFHRPEDGNKNRTGVPIFVLLRKNGSVAARLTRLAAVSPMAADQANFDNYIKRFEEMLKIADADATEIENNYPGAGSIVFKANGGAATGEICNADFVDTFKLDGVGGNALQQVTVKGETDAEVGVSFVKLTDGVAETIGKTVYGKLSEGVTIDNTFAEAGEFYVKVEGKDITSAEFNVASATADNFHPFSITGTTVLIPGEQRATGSAPEGKNAVTVRLVKDETYCLKGVDAAAATEILKSVGEGTEGTYFTALVAGDQSVPLTGEQLTYQLWKPGELTFAAAEGAAKEGLNETVEFVIERKGGSSGKVTAHVAVDTTATDLIDFYGEKRYEFEDLDLVWEDGDATPQTLAVGILNNSDFDGNGQVVLKLTVTATESADVGTKVAEGGDTYTLKVTEDEKQMPGRGAILAAEPFFGAKGKVYAKASQGTTLQVGRIEARDGDVKATLKSALAGVTLAGDGYDPVAKQISWANRDSEPKAITVTGVPAGKSVQITLGAVGTFKTLSGSNTVTVVSVADDAPEFAAADETLTIYRYVAVSNTYKLASTLGGKITFKKLLGTLPAGLKATYSAADDAMLLAGVPTAKAGSFTVTYQVSEKRGTQVVAGLVKRFAITVMDPTDTKKSPTTSNPAVAKARTFKSLPVLDEAGQRLAGLLQVTIPATGKASAKFTGEEGSVSLSAKSWCDFDPETLTLTAELVSKKGHALNLVVNADGSVEATLLSPNEANVLTVETDGTQWSKSNPATAWKGYYTVALPVREASIVEETPGMAPRGTGYLTLKMNTSTAWNAGTVTWAGLLPDGTKVSGKTPLTCLDEAKTALPIFTRSSTDVFSAFATIQANAIDKTDRRSVLAPVDVTPYWKHTGKVAAAKAGFAVELDVFGGIYDTSDDLVVCCTEDYDKTDFALTFDTSKLGQIFQNGGVPTAVQPGELKVEASKMTLVTKPTGMSLVLTRSTGVVTGSVRIPYGDAGRYVTAKFAGVVLTGWGDGCGCGTGEDPVRPLVNGTFYFSDKVSYEVTQGTRTTQKTLAVTRGGEVRAE